MSLEEDFVQVLVPTMAPHPLKNDDIQPELDGATKELRSETVLREMWQESADPDEKRQLRTRMFKLREDRLKDFYGREGQEILDSILKPELNNEGLEINVEAQSSRTITSSSVVASEIQSDKTTTFSSAFVELKQDLTSSKSMGNSASSLDRKEDLKQIKNRINRRDRSSQLKEIEGKSAEAKKIQAQHSPRRKSSVGDIEMINVNLRKGSQSLRKNTADIINNNRSKVLVSRNGMDNESRENRASRILKRGEGGGTHTNNNVATTNGKSSVSVTSKTTMDGSTRALATDGRKVKTSTTSSTMVTNTRSTKSLSTMTTIKSSSTTSTTTAFSVSSTSNKKVDGTRNTIASNKYVRGSKSESIPIGSVQIEEMVETLPVLALLTRGQLGTGAKKSSNVTGGQKKFINKKLSKCSPKDVEAINRNLKSSGGGQMTKSEMKKTSVVRTCSRGSPSNIHGSNARSGASAQDKGNKVVNKSRETSPQRSGISKGNSSRDTKTTLKTGESLQTPVIKVDRAEDTRASRGWKKDNNKTEESIIKELDILDNYLSQRSISIEDSNVKEVKMNGTKGTTMGVDHKKVVSSGNIDTGIDVMESGVEPPFTKSEYKYHCPQDDHRQPIDHEDHYHEDQGHNSADKNTNESPAPLSGLNRITNTITDDTKLNSNIEDQIIVDVDETSLGLFEKSRARPVAKVNLSSATTTTTNSSSPVNKSNIKKSSSAVIEEISSATNKKVGSTFPKKSSDSQMQSKQQKYEADILNRPSVFEGSRNKKKNSGVEEGVKSKPNPNPRVKKTLGDEGEEVEDYSHFVKEKVRGDDYNDDDGDDDDDPLRPHTMKQDQDHSGAVLKAKSLFENKAQEAAMDRASTDFDLDKGIQTAKVSKRAALFEARSRGERISVSSESSIANSVSATEEKDVIVQRVDFGSGNDSCNKENTSNTTTTTTRGDSIDRVESNVVVKSTSAILTTSSTPQTPTLKKEKSSLTSTSIKRENKVDALEFDQHKSSSNTTRTFAKKNSQHESTKTSQPTTVRRKSSAEVKFDGCDLQKTEKVVSISTKTQGVKRRESYGKSETRSCKREESPKSSRRTSQEKKSNSPIRRSSREEVIEKKHERRRSSSSSPRKNSLQNFNGIGSDKLEQDENKYVATVTAMKSTSAMSASVQINSNRMTTAEFNAVDSMEDIEELQRLLEKAVDYDERSKIRGRVRALKRKAALVKRPSTENYSSESCEISFTPSVVTNITTNPNDVVNIMNAKNKSVSSTSSDSKKSYERRRSSGEVPLNKVTMRKKSAEMLERKNSDKSELKTNSISKSNISTMTGTTTALPETPGIVTAQVTISSSSAERATKPEYAGERRLSSETQELLSTRKYSRGTGKQGELEKMTKDRNESPEMTRKESQILEKEKDKQFTRKDSRDKTSPPRAVSALIESVSASVTTQKSREMTKAEKYESDILSRPSVFTKQRQLEQPIKSETTQSDSESQILSKTLKFTQNVSSRKNSQELVAEKNKESSSKTLQKSTEDQGKVQKVSRKHSSEERDIKTCSSTRFQQRQAYTRKSSSKELKVEKSEKLKEKLEKEQNSELVEQSEKIEMVSKIPTNQNQSQSTPKGKGATRTFTTKDDQTSEDDKSKSDTEINFNQQSHSSSPTLHHHPKSQSKSQPEQPTLKKVESNNANVVKNESAKQMDSSTTSTRRTSSAINSSNTKNYSKSLTSASNSDANSSRLQGTNTVTSSYGVGPTEDGIPLFGLRALRKIKQVQEQISTTTPTSITSTKSEEISKDECTKQSLRSNENFGLRALKKGSAASRGFEDERKSTKSSVPRGSTPETKSEFLSSTTTRLETDSVEHKGALNVSMKTSPKKSILKKTSSFTSQIGGVVKSMSDEGNNSDEIGESYSANQNEQDFSEEFTKSSDTKASHNFDDSSWRRKSASPSPDPNSSSTHNSLSRGKVGRSSVKEMSKRFETSETSNFQSQQESDGNKPTFMRESSPSRIPAPVKANTTTTTITTTTKSSVEVSGGNPDNNIKIEVSREPSIADHEEVYYPSDSDGGGSGIIRITRTVTTTSSSNNGSNSGRSFLNDQSPIQNLSDAIERMKGEDEQKKYAHCFEEQDECSESGEKQRAIGSEGLGLLNKFIGAQVIMQAVEPMLVTKKVTMSSLIVNGVNVDLEMDTAKLRQLLAEVDGGDRERIENRLRILESGTSEPERSSSTSSVPRPRPLTKTLSIGGVQLGASDVGDVTGELMPLILGQLRSSLDNYGASGSALGSGGSVGNIRTDNSNNTCTNTNANALQNADTNTNSSTSSSTDSSSKCSSRGVEESSSSVVGSGEECLFDSGTESGEDVPPPTVPPATPATATTPPQLVEPPHHVKSESSPAEFSNFMEGLRNTLKRNQNKERILRSLSHFDALSALALSGGGGGCGPSTVASASDSAIAKAYQQGESALVDVGNHAGGDGVSNLSGKDGNKISNKSSAKKASVKTLESETDRNLIQQVDKVLTLLRNSLVKDPSCLKSLGCSDLQLNPESEKGKELIALIDRLKSSLSSGNDRGESSIKESPKLPTLISTCEHTETAEQPCIITTAAARAQEMLAWAQIRPPDTVPLPWVNHMQPPSDRKNSTSGDSNDHYSQKGRGRRRSHARSHTVGVTQEELAEARRYLQESAYRNAKEEKKQQKQEEKVQAADPELPSPLITSVKASRDGGRRDSSGSNKVDRSNSRDSVSEHELARQSSWHQDVEKGLTNMPRPYVKSSTYDSGFQPPPERRMTYATIDDSTSSIFGKGEESGGKGSQFTKVKPFRTISLDNAYDPSKSFFTKEETVQIAIHQAAIKKQMSEEEDRRKRRNSLSSSQNIYSSTVPTAVRDFSLALPKPYAPPQKQKQMQSGIISSGGNGSQNNTSTTSTTTTVKDNHNNQNQKQSGGDSGFTEESGSESRHPKNDQLVLYETSQMSPISISSSPRGVFNSSLLSTASNNNPNSNQRIENVQISLKELNTSEFPQLQIAITLNTNAGNNGSGNNNNIITSTNNNNETTIQSHFLPTRNSAISNTSNTTIGNIGGGAFSNQGVDETMSSTSSAKAMRYKSKNERKNRLKRANTIDIPQPPTYLQSNDDDSEMDDEEEDSDGNMLDNISKSSQLSYAPFKPKTDGDKKFLAFLEKNNAAAEIRPGRPAYLGVNDKFWNNRFFNLKSNFESSSQGSSPSPSPILSPNRPAPRSVSEMALTHGATTPEPHSRPVWASSSKGQLPQQVKNKLHVFESKNMEASKGIPWRSSAPSAINQTQSKYGHPQQPSNANMNRVPGQFVASSSVYSTSNVHTPPHPQMQQQLPRTNFAPQNYGNLQRPVALHGTQQSSGPESQMQQHIRPLHKPTDGVHMVHATASALEAMKRSGFGPTAIVHPHPSRTRDSHFPQQTQTPPPVSSKGVIVQDKVELPWAKKGPLSPSEATSRDPNVGRILMSKAKFEQMNESEIQPPVTHVISPPPIPPKSANAKAFAMAMSQSNKAPISSLSSRQSFPNSSVPNVPNLASSYGQSQQFPPALGPKPKFGSVGATQSFDEAFKRKTENEQSRIGNLQMQLRNKEAQQPQISASTSPPAAVTNKEPQGYQRAPGSAFARNIPASELKCNTNSQEEEDSSRRITSTSVDQGEEGGGEQIQTPVVAKVMGAAQQQRAAIGGNRISSREDSEQASRLTNARSNIRNILNQFSHSPTDDSSDTNSPPIMKINLQLSAPNPISKSLSGDILHSECHPGQQSTYRPTSLVVGSEEISLHSSHSPSLKSHHGASKPKAALSPNPPSASVSPQPKPYAGGKRGSLPSPISDQESNNKRPSQNRPTIPKQRSLSEFPKIAAPPKIGVLTIQTDLEALSQSKKSLKPQTKTHTQKVPDISNKPTTTPQSHRNLPVQKQSSLLQQQQLLQQINEQPAKVLKSYPTSTSDNLQRTSSGSSIFNRAQSLFLSSQEAQGIHQPMKNRPKPPTLPKTHGMFPKQFEAQMSPDSAKKKQREVDAYFKQLTQETIKESSIKNSSKSHLRKSASHSKILNRQRSVSDGEDDVDKIFESLFKASEERFSFNRSQISRAWASSSSKSLDMSNLSESKRLISFEEHKDQLRQYQQQPHPFFNINAENVVKAETGNNHVSPHLQNQSQTIQKSQVEQSNTQSQQSTMMQSSSSTSSSVKSTCSSSSSSVGGGLNKFKQMDQQAKANSGGASLFKLNPGLKTSANNAKDIILYWCQCRIRDYENVKIENFSSSWSDGLAFCALIHHFFPDAFDYKSLDPRNRRHNFDLAFRVADEKAGIYPLLDTEDMIIMGRRPDWKCVFTYVQSLYRGLKDLS